MIFEDRFSKQELNKYWLARCFECGWRGLSKELGTDRPIGQTGCCGDMYCPECNSRHIDDYKYSISIGRRLLWLWRKLTFYFWRKERRERKAIERYHRAHMNEKPRGQNE